MRVFIGILSLIFAIVPAAHAMTSTNFIVDWDSVNSGGTDWSTSTNYAMHDTIGEQATGYGTSTNYVLHAGYRQSEPIPMISLSIGAQENLTRVAYSALSISGLTVTVADASFYATGSHIAVVENEGLGQKTIIGKIAAVNGNVLIVDKWDGQTGDISESPAGGNDVVYRVDGRAIELGVLQQNVAKTGVVRTDVSTNAYSGYVLTVISDGFFRIATTTGHLIDVADGTVTGGDDEYGARVFGTSASSTGSDFAVSTSGKLIQESLVAVENDRIGMVFKASANDMTPGGEYYQRVSYCLTARF